jgi:hypothetical protein
MELEQHQVMKFLHAKGLKLYEIATELPNSDHCDAQASASIKY